MILGLGLINQLNARSGTERFEARVGVRLVAARSDWQWRVYTRGVRPPEWEGAGGFEEVVCPPTGAVRGGRLWSEQVSWERALRRAPPDLLVALAFSPPAGSRIPFVMTVHDVTPLERPQDYAGPSGFYWSWVLRKVAPRAARLTTPSAWVRDRCAAALGYPPEKASGGCGNWNPSCRDEGRPTARSQSLKLSRPDKILRGQADHGKP